MKITVISPTMPPTRSICLSRELAERAHHSAMSLKYYIEVCPPQDPLLWAPDRKTPVVNLSSFKQAILDLERLNEALSAPANRSSGKNEACQ